MKNSIEEDIKNAEYFIKSIKKDKEYKEENGWHGYYNKEIVELARILQHVLSDYKRVLKENEQLNKKVDLMENYMVENDWEICFDNIYAELNNCNGMERDWCRGDKLEKQDIHKYFNKKLLESEE